MEKNMELEEAIEILNNYLCETHRKFCSIGAVGIPNKEYFAIETVLNHLTKQDKMIELMSRFIDTELSSEHLSKVLKIEVKPLETYREDIKQYFEKKVEEETNG